LTHIFNKCIRKFQVLAHSVRPATLVINNGVKETESTLSRGDNSICINSQKPVTLSTKGCVEYDVEPGEFKKEIVKCTFNSNSTLIDRIDDPSVVDSSLRIILKPIKYTVSGFITTKKMIPDLKLIASSDTRKVEVETRKTSDGYSFSFMALPGEDLVRGSASKSSEKSFYKAYLIFF